MLKILPVPVPVQTSEGRIFARYALVPQQQDEPWWLFYRAERGEWFTLMMDGQTRPA